MDRMGEKDAQIMCYSNCPYENRNGECGISTTHYPEDAHCVYREGDDDPHVEEKIGGDR